ncbi:hypothetical protein KIPB_004346 [Kipferlia bialata]|uniref:Zona occludens toxin N-terminal domain-containing protein n=2 Tax=Kipferlia bialata TaxID=797122 RepID=A0A9K3CUY4_9EUKA|nr:hypothetical protein KIPB_004346 [Kipferlia bialata]|eukprot:g4346.t1
MVTLVCSYDRTQVNYCESIGLGLVGAAGVVASPCVVLVSPHNYRQRQQFFSSFPNVQVHPLLFPFEDLDASYLRMLMGLDSGKVPLYEGVLMALLRRVQRSGRRPTWTDFLTLIANAGFTPAQMQPLQQRVDMLAGLVMESDINKESTAHNATSCISLLSSLQPGSLVICDLTDPLLGPEDANAIFSVVSQLFVGSHATYDKLLVLDEAHKYLQVEGPLSKTLLTTVRQMRHCGCRVVLSTQSPSDIPREFLELCSLAVMHNASLLLSLSHCGVGECLVFDPHASSRLGSEVGGAVGNCIKARIRPRLTMDAGSSIRTATTLDRDTPGEGKERERERET